VGAEELANDVAGADVVVSGELVEVFGEVRVEQDLECVFWT
jgi:hypothetical protein